MSMVPMLDERKMGVRVLLTYFLVAYFLIPSLTISYGYSDAENTFECGSLVVLVKICLIKIRFLGAVLEWNLFFQLQVLDRPFFRENTACNVITKEWEDQ